MEEYTLEDIVNHLHVEGIKGAQPVVTDYDWDDDYLGEDYVRVTVWLKRIPEEEND